MCTASSTRRPSGASGIWGIGVYSDEPFPPLDEAAPNARMPSFSGQDATPANAR